MADNKPANTYAIKPQFRKKFMPVKVTGIIQDELKEKLENQEYNVDKAPKLAKEITDSIKKKLKDLGWERYKFVVQTVVGEQRGEGIKMGCRCFWDEDTDNFAQGSFQNDSIFATSVAFGVYLY